MTVKEERTYDEKKKRGGNTEANRNRHVATIKPKRLVQHAEKAGHRSTRCVLNCFFFWFWPPCDIRRCDALRFRFLRKRGDHRVHLRLRHARGTRVGLNRRAYGRLQIRVRTSCFLRKRRLGRKRNQERERNEKNAKHLFFERAAHEHKYSQRNRLFLLEHGDNADLDAARECRAIDPMTGKRVGRFSFEASRRLGEGSVTVARPRIPVRRTYGTLTHV